jgi:ABC-type dipeptide/oligopeptide/nickel transport system permease subunit
MKNNGLENNNVFHKKFLKGYLPIVGLTFIVIIVFVTIFAEYISPYDPYEIDLSNRLAPPSKEHWLGQDDLGRDVLSRIIYGSRVSLTVGLLTVAISVVIGTSIGMVAGYYGGWIDEIIMRITDIFLAFPVMLLAIGIMAILGGSLNNVIIALSIVGWKTYARLARGQVLVEKEKEYVKALRAIGFGSFRILFRHILLNISVPIIVAGTLGIAGVIVQEAGISFLGLGVQPPLPSWGVMLSEGHQYILKAYHLTTFPALAIMLTVMGFNFIGDGLRDVIDPTLRY